MKMKISREEFEKRFCGLFRFLKDHQKISVAELLTPEFLSRCSRFKSAAELFEVGRIAVSSQEDLAATPAEKWDAFIKQNTSYSSWEEVLKAAGAEWTERELAPYDFGLVFEDLEQP